MLEAAGISTESVHQDGHWLLSVGSHDLGIATAELQAYQRDKSDTAVYVSPRAAVFGGAWAGVASYTVVMLLVALLSTMSASGQLWKNVGMMRAGDVLSGQWWRAVTALTLHVDAGHLLSNLLFGLVFGFMVGRILGGGVGWLTIVAAGTFGNLANALVHDASHTSIGASTAVFGALGVMVAHSLRPQLSIPQNAMRRWAPLIGGVLVFGFTGIGGERTDVGAHLAGFLAGLMFGWLACRMPESYLASRAVQCVAGLGAMMLVVSAWTAAIFAAH